jgi:hypothetical protein
MIQMKKLQLIIDQQQLLIVNGIKKLLSMHEMSFKHNNRMKHHNKPMNNDQEKVRSIVIFRYKVIESILKTNLLVAKPLIYPNHVLHPEVIPSLNDVPAQLTKRRNVRFTDQSAIDSFETEIPLEIASSLQDELERAVQHQLEI